MCKWWEWRMWLHRGPRWSEGGSEGLWAASEEAMLRQWIGLKAEAGRSKGNFSNHIKRIGRPSQPCLGAVKQSLGFMQETTERSNHFIKENRALWLGSRCFACVIMGAVYAFAQRDSFPNDHWHLLVFVVWVSLSSETNLDLCSEDKYCGVCGV